MQLLIDRLRDFQLVYLLVGLSTGSLQIQIFFCLERWGF